MQPQLVEINPQLNYVELTGNLAKDPNQNKETTFMTIAVWSGKERPAHFIEVTFFKNIKTYNLSKGTRVNIVGHLSCFKDKHTKFMRLGVVGHQINVITYPIKKTRNPNTYNQNNPSQEIIPWELEM